MPNVFKFSESSSEKSLRKGNFSIGVGDVPKGPSSVTGFYQGVTPPIDGWMIYKKIDGDQVPFRIYSATQGSLVNIVNRIEGKTFSQIWECLNHYALTSSSVIVNKDFAPIVTDGLVLSLDASNVLSYPATGSSWYDLSNSTNNMPLVNNPMFSSATGSSLLFSGTNYGTLSYNSSFNIRTAITLSVFLRRNSVFTQLQDCFILSRPPAWYFYDAYNSGFMRGEVFIDGQRTAVCTTSLPNDGNWYKIDYTYDSTSGWAVMYKNGQNVSSTQLTGRANYLIDQSNVNFANPFQSTQGKSYFVLNLSIYNRALSAAEILQNYNATKDRFDIDTFIQRVNTDSGTFRLGAELDLSREFTRTKGASVSMIPVAGKASKLYSITPSGGEVDFTVSRNGTASYIDRDGLLKLAGPDVPRFDYDPVTKEFRGLLIEPSAQNLILQSQNFTTNWEFIGTTVSANITATTDPFGTYFANELKETAVTNNHFIFQLNNITTNTTYTGSIFLKKTSTSPDWIQLAFSTTGLAGFANFNLTLGSVGTIQTGCAASIENYGNGWYRCRLTQTANATGQSGGPVVVFTNNQNTAVRYSSYLGVATRSIYIFGAQFETGSISTSYIPTLGSQVTRPADGISKTSVSGYIGQTEGTIYWEVLLSRVNAGTLIALGAQNDRIQIFFDSSTGIYALIRVGGVNADYNAIIPAIPATGGVYKIALGYKANDYCFAVNGVAYDPSTASRGVPANMSAIYLGASVFSTGQLTDYIRSAAIFPTRFTNTQLAELTKPS